MKKILLTLILVLSFTACRNDTMNNENKNKKDSTNAENAELKITYDTNYRLVGIKKHFNDINTVEISYGEGVNSFITKLPTEVITNIKTNPDPYTIRFYKREDQLETVCFVVDNITKKEYKVLDKNDMPEKELIEIINYLSKFGSIQNDCIDKTEKIKESMRIEFFDFNSDGTDEIIIWGRVPCFIVHHCDECFIFKKVNNNWRLIFESSGVEIYEIIKEKRNGYYVFSAGGIIGRASIEPKIYIGYYYYDGSQYQEFNSTVEKLELK